LKDGGNHDDEQHGAEIGAHKAWHNAGFVKRLSLEDGFDSREEDKTTMKETTMRKTMMKRKSQLTANSG
jgi:hypothetical protein